MEEIHQHTPRYAAKRWLIFFGFILLLSFSLLGYRLVDLQVVRHDQLTVAARGNTIRTIEREARRGNILDRNGNLLATSLFVKTVCGHVFMNIVQVVHVVVFAGYMLCILFYIITPTSD